MNLSLIIIVTFFIATLFANYRLRIFSVKPTMLGAIFLLTLFIQIVPGTVLVSYFDYPMAFGVDNAITEEIKTNTFIYTLASITLLLLLVSLFSCFFHFDIDFEKLETNHTRAKLLTFFSFIVIVVKMASVGNIPFLMAIRGDSVGAALAKAQILKNEVGFGGLFIGYIFVYFPYVSLIYSYCHKKRHAYGTLLFRINLFLIIIYSVYDMQKSKFVVVLFILFVLYLRLSKKINYSIVIATPIISLLVLSTFFILLHNTPVSDVFDSVLARLFIGQTEGAFMIYQALTPDIGRIAYGMPLASFFGVHAVDPAAEIITIFFPTAGDAWVNSNSYFQAHAWSIFGDISLIIGPLVVALNILGLCIIKELFSKIDSAYASCVYIVIILTLPIVNDFSYFLFFKSWFCIMVLMTFYVFTIKVIEIYGQAIKNKTQR
ncbi:hypothetical protein ACK3YT_06625 [Aeromonas caviae]|uniref:hypothetical protein n=1 Tax=Aeromonas caviae TaxID=648 RepID=UPI00191FE58E|nr:hypothetical protein [Aeromonas caviae]MBL0438293.1 hypothetical protein [Aeromonas caviae]MBL0582956.1 hypothetical protein [Aeromonas caviae]